MPEHYHTCGELELRLELKAIETKEKDME